MARDFYEVLGVPKKAPTDEIKKAYDTLSDPEKRKQYDAGGMFSGFGGGRGFPGGGGGGFTGDLGDIFSTLFGRGGGGPSQDQRRGRDLETEVQLSFDQAMHGTEISVTVPKQAACPTCGGSGAKPGTSPVTCPRCGGRGVDSESQGFLSISQPCPQCGGRGEVIEQPCETCSGAGRTLQRK